MFVYYNPIISFKWIGSNVVIALFPCTCRLCVPGPEIIS